MFIKFIICLILLLLEVFVQGEELIQPGPPDVCFKTKSYHINDRYHKDVPSPQGSDFPECQSWKESSCCTRALAEELSSRSKTLEIYNFRKDLCGTISPPCAEYLRVCKLAERYTVKTGKTSDSGPSEIGTMCNRPLYKGHCLRSQLYTLPIVPIHLQLPRRG